MTKVESTTPLGDLSTGRRLARPATGDTAEGENAADLLESPGYDQTYLLARGPPAALHNLT